MDIHRIINRKNIVLLVSAILLVVVAGICIDKLIFRLKSTDPPLESVATSAVNIRFTFSQPIKSLGSVVVENTPVAGVSIQGDSVVIPTTSLNLEDGSNYSVVLSDVRSQWFGGVINKIERTFKVKYVDFDRLSKEQREAQVKNSDSGQINDPFFDNIFPIVTEKYQIETTNAGDGDTPELYVTFFDEVPDYDNNGTSSQLPDNIAEKYRDEALKTIRDYGGDPSKYIILYSNLHLNDLSGSHLHGDE